MKVQTKTIVRTALAGTLVLALAIGFVGCSSKNSDDGKSDTTVLKVGASPTPHAEILKQVKSDLEKEGVDLQITEYSDYVTPNTALNDGDIDANFFQHKPYLDDFNTENGTDLVSVAKIHFEPLGIYPGKSKSLEDVKDGAKIAVPNDATNEARALLLLETEGLIKLKDGAGIKATPKDVAENPHNIEFVEAEAASVPRLLPDVDYAVINGNYVLSSGLKASDALASEDADSLAADTYANIIAVKAGNETKPAIEKLVKALESENVRSYINSTYEGLVIPVF